MDAAWCAALTGTGGPTSAGQERAAVGGAAPCVVGPASAGWASAAPAVVVRAVVGPAVAALAAVGQHVVVQAVAAQGVAAWCVVTHGVAVCGRAAPRGRGWWSSLSVRAGPVLPSHDLTGQPVASQAGPTWRCGEKAGPT